MRIGVVTREALHFNCYSHPRFVILFTILQRHNGAKNKLHEVFFLIHIR